VANPSSLSDYRGNANPLPQDQASAVPVLYRPIGARRVIVGVTSTLLILFPSIFRWILIRNTGVDSIWIISGQPAAVGIGREITPQSNYLVNPVPFASINAISENAPNNRIYVSEF